MLDLFCLLGQEIGLIHCWIPSLRVVWLKKICNLLMSGFLEMKPKGFISMLTSILNSFLLFYTSLFNIEQLFVLPHVEKFVIWTKVNSLFTLSRENLGWCLFFSCWSLWGHKLVTASQCSFYSYSKVMGWVGWRVEDCERTLFSGASSRQGSNTLFMRHWARCATSVPTFWTGSCAPDLPPASPVALDNVRTGLAAHSVARSSRRS